MIRIKYRLFGANKKMDICDKQEAEKFVLYIQSMGGEVISEEEM